jgi:alkylhydroperoxidase/carboxymuconolactone decarboxylase family protein YurZ
MVEFEDVHRLLLGCGGSVWNPMADPTPITVPPALAGLDPAALAALRDARVALERMSGLDERSIELARLGALIALGAPAESIRAHVERARAIGMPDEEIWGAVLSVATLVGVPRLIAVVPEIRAALGTTEIPGTART